VLDQPTTAAVLVDRTDATLTLTLDRPHRHNAVTTRVRDELCDGLELALVDDTIREVRLVGHGPSFCSGGDLGEFGARPDPVDAHVTRLAQSPARLLHHLRDRTTVLIHGHTLGSGIEMAAFAGRVIADPATRIGLPEVGLGLVPGAGGTVSITRRIGRQRTLALALGTDTIGADTAAAWGLVDTVMATAMTPFGLTTDRA
jgi:enoyl-CoA hydratase/carnithine racemase